MRAFLPVAPSSMRTCSNNLKGWEFPPRSSRTNSNYDVHGPILRLAGSADRLRPSETTRLTLGRNGRMKNIGVLILCISACMPLPVLAQEKSQQSASNAALEKELFALELKWMKAEFDKKMTGPDSMGELWTDEFFDVLPGGRVVNKQEMMDLMAKTDRQPGTGAFPDHFKLMAGYGNGAFANDHTTIKGVDANWKIVVIREMGVLRMFVKEKGKWRVAGDGW